MPTHSNAFAQGCSTGVPAFESTQAKMVTRTNGMLEHGDLPHYTWPQPNMRQAQSAAPPGAASEGLAGAVCPPLSTNSCSSSATSSQPNSDAEMPAMPSNVFPNQLTSPIEPQHQRTLNQSGSMDTQVVNLNVGGIRYTTKLSTLTAVDGSYLQAMFSGRWASPTSTHNHEIFIDRDGDVFRYILSYLRSHCYHDCLLLLPDTASECQLLRSEADFYGLPALAELCSYGRLGAHLALVPASQPSPQFAIHAAQDGKGARPSSAQPASPSHMQANSSEPSAPASANRAPSPSPVRQDFKSEQQSLNSSNLSRYSCRNSLQLPYRASTLTYEVQQSRRLLTIYESKWSSQPQLCHLADIIVSHLIQAPLAAQQIDLIQCLSDPKPGLRLELALQYYSFGDVRIELEASLVSGCTCHSSSSSSSSPEPASSDERTYYYNFKIRETPKSFVLQRNMPGDVVPALEVYDSAEYKEELLRWVACAVLLPALQTVSSKAVESLSLSIHPSVLTT